MQCIVTLPACFDIFKKSVLRYIFLNFGYLTSGHCIYASKDVRIHGYFSKSEGVREQKSLRRSAFIDMLPSVTGKVSTLTTHERLVWR
jgi:hypothetical protein